MAVQVSEWRAWKAAEIRRDSACFYLRRLSRTAPFMRRPLLEIRDGDTCTSAASTQRSNLPEHAQRSERCERGCGPACPLKPELGHTSVHCMFLPCRDSSDSRTLFRYYAVARAAVDGDCSTSTNLFCCGSFALLCDHSSSHAPSMFIILPFFAFELSAPVAIIASALAMVHP